MNIENGKEWRIALGFVISWFYDHIKQIIVVLNYQIIVCILCKWILWPPCPQVNLCFALLTWKSSINPFDRASIVFVQSLASFMLWLKYWTIYLALPSRPSCILHCFSILDENQSINLWTTLLLIYSILWFSIRSFRMILLSSSGKWLPSLYR